MAQITIQQTFDLALQHHQAGRLREAENLYRQILADQPNHAHAMHLLGAIAHQAGRNDIAVDLIRRAIAMNPNIPEAYFNLGVALKNNGQLDEALDAYRQAIALRPDNANAYGNLGAALIDKGQLDEAMAAYCQAITLNPSLDEAHYNLANVLKDKGQLDEALAAYRRAIALKPNYPEAHTNLGSVLSEKRQIDEAIAAHRQAIALRPNFPEAHNNLGMALTEKRQFDEAIAAYRQAITLKPDYAEAYTNLGAALSDKGQFDGAIAAYRRAIALNVNLPQAHSNLVFALHYHPAYSAETIAEEHRRWNQIHAEPLRKVILPHANNRDADRPLRIGYVSPDFRNHSVGHLVLPLFEHHDRTNFQFFCYANVRNPDNLTERFNRACDGWRNISGLDDRNTADLIRDDAIDILVDLSGHTSANRLLVFARKPAPIQVTYLGYPDTTGMTAMDYRLSDNLADPPGMTDALTVERLWRLAGCAWCYQPTGMPEIQPRSDRPITFGCLNNFCKVNPVVLEMWARVLANSPDSRMLLLAPPSEVRQKILRIFEKFGVDPARIELIDRLQCQAYLQTFNRIDVSLDTYPYHGTMTTCESLWMGVPVVTLAGRTHVSRVGVSLLTHAGLGELVADSVQQYIHITTELARDRSRLFQLRSTLRDRMRQSLLMDAPRFARNIEAAYRQMWRNWVQG